MQTKLVLIEREQLEKILTAFETDDWWSKLDAANKLRKKLEEEEVAPLPPSLEPNASPPSSEATSRLMRIARQLVSCEKNNDENWQFFEEQIKRELSRETPSSQWRQNNEADPHQGHYGSDRERAQLTLGHLTDDELANAAFMNYDARPSVQQLISGSTTSPIVYMTAVKERIRWLSRSLQHQIDKNSKESNA